MYFTRWFNSNREDFANQQLSEYHIAQKAFKEGYNLKSQNLRIGSFAFLIIVILIYVLLS